MTPKEFVEKFYPYAKEVENETKIPAVAILAQAALESGWNKYLIGNNIFGIKYRQGDKGYKKVLTTEHSKNKNAFNGNNVKSVYFNINKGVYVFRVWQYFAEYDSPKEAFKAHADLLLSDRYKGALQYKDSPKDFLLAVWKAGYATDVNYGDKICKMVDSVEKRLPRKPEFIPPKMVPIKAKVK
jgi:flagellum-specific peptidoglycan hydrolase FlgJ